MLKGEKDIAINFLNKAIELEPELLQTANQEKVFAEIKEHITVSVKMENEVEEEPEEIEENQYLLKLEDKAREYLESTTILVRDMSDNTISQKAEKAVDKIFQKKLENQKELGSN